MSNIPLRKLNTKQINILKTAYLFRYLTTDNLAKQRNLTQNSAYSALQILHTNGYLGKKYNKNYRLQSKSARYFLTSQVFKPLRFAAVIVFVCIGMHLLHKDRMHQLLVRRRDVRLFRFGS